MFLYQETLMFALQIGAPIDRIFEFMTRLFQNFYTLGVRQPYKIVIHDELQPVDQFLVVHLAQKFEIVLTVIERIANQIFEEILRQIHVLSDFVERDFRLYHPKLGQVARRIRILGAERRAERINRAQRHRTQFTFELSRYSEAGRFAEEILAIIHRSVLGLRYLVQVESRYLKHSSCTFAVATRN